VPLLAWGGIRRKWGWVGAGSFFGQRLSGGFGALALLVAANVRLLVGCLFLHTSIMSQIEGMR